MAERQEKIFIRKQLTRLPVLLYVRSMSQRSIQLSTTIVNRLLAVDDVLQLGGVLLLALITLVLLITNGGAG